MATASTDRPIEYGDEQQVTGWVGWIWFAGVMMMLAGGLEFMHGLIAAINDEWVVWGNRADLYLDLSTWGWVHMILGAVVFLAGIGVLSGNILARIVGVALACLSLIANFLFLPAFPVWAVVVIVIDLLVIYALTVHGREVRAT